MAVKTTLFIFPASEKKGYPQAEVAPEVAEQLLEEGENKKRLVIAFPNGTKFHRALQRSKDGVCFIRFGKSTLRDAKVEPGMQVDVTLTEDTSEFGMPFPEELQEVLAQDEEGNQKFLALKPGLRRSLLYHISSAKTIDTRIKRSLDIVHKLKTNSLHSQKN
jgi:hypothetical protein